LKLETGNFLASEWRGFRFFTTTSLRPLGYGGQEERRELREREVFLIAPTKHLEVDL
jgi:hypothetical protein